MRTIACSTCACSRDQEGDFGLPEHWLTIAQHLEDGGRFFLGKFCSIWCVVSGEWETILDRREPADSAEPARHFRCRQCGAQHTGTYQKPGWLSLATHDTDGRRHFYGSFCGREHLIEYAEGLLSEMMAA